MVFLKAKCGFDGIRACWRWGVRLEVQHQLLYHLTAEAKLDEVLDAQLR